MLKFNLIHKTNSQSNQTIFVIVRLLRLLAISRPKIDVITITQYNYFQCYLAVFVYFVCAIYNNIDLLLRLKLLQNLNFIIALKSRD
jgi:hypothetical protein